MSSWNLHNDPLILLCWTTDKYWLYWTLFFLCWIKTHLFFFFLVVRPTAVAVANVSTPRGESWVLMLLNIPLAGLGWSLPCDIWSVGCILVELCSVRLLVMPVFPLLPWYMVLTLKFIGGGIVSDTWEPGTPSNDGEGFGTRTRAHDTEG